MKNKHNYGDLTVLEVKQYIERGGNSIIIPVGSMEQHGYHLPNMTDCITSTAISSRVAAKLDMLYMPPLYCSYSGGTLHGTLNFSPNTLVTILKEMFVSLAQQGFKNIFIVLGHGGSENFGVLNASLPIMLRENALFDDVMIALTPFWEYAAAFKRNMEEFDGHAGFSATSMLLYLCPELVTDTREMDSPEVIEGMQHDQDFYQKVEKLCDHPAVLPKVTQKDCVKVGVMGEIREPNAEAGKAMIDEAVAALAELYAKLLKDRKPRL